MDGSCHGGLQYYSSMRGSIRLAAQTVAIGPLGSPEKFQETWRALNIPTKGSRWRKGTRRQSDGVIGADKP